MRPYTNTKSIRRFLSALLIAVLFAHAGAGLASAEDTVTSIQLDAVTTPVQLYVEDGSVSLTLWANIQGSTTPKNVTADAVWTSSSSAVKVDRGVLSATGAETSATITAKYKTFTASATVRADYRFASLKLQNADGTEAPSSLDIELGNTLSFKATAYDDSGSPTSATNGAQWLTTNTGVATVSAGAITLLSPGTVIITAKYKGRSDSITLNVSSPYKSLDITHSLGADPIDMKVGDADYSMRAVVAVKNDNSSLDVTADASWTSSNASVVKVEGGVVTAVGAGTAIVTAKRYGVQDAVTFYVQTPYEAMKLTTSKPLTMTLYSAPIEVTATVMKGTADPVDVSLDAVWQTSDGAVAAIDKSTGKLLVKAKGVGSASLTASYKGLTKTLTVAVYPSINAITISKEKLDLFENDSGDLPSVKGVTVAGEETDISKLVVWKSSDESVLSIANGKWTTKNTGAVTLTAEVYNEPDAPTSKKTSSIQVKVHKKLLTLLTDVKSMSVVVGKEAALPKVRVVFADGDELDVTGEMAWKSSSPNLLVKTDVMKGLLPASATLTGTYLGKSVAVRVAVEEEFTSFEISPKPLNVTINKSTMIKVTGTTKSGKKTTLSTRLTWSATGTNLVTVKGSSVIGIAEGSGKLTATIQDKTLELPFTVKSKLSKLEASDKSLQMKAAGTTTIKLSAIYENGKTADVARTATLSTANAKVATVNQGVIKAVGKGTTIIKAAYEGKTVSIRVTVK